MNILLSLALLFTSSLAGNYDSKEDGKTGVTYTVTVVRAEGLPDEDMDTFFYTNRNDVYVEIFGYGTKGDDSIKEYSTRTIDGSDTPNWNEKFVFAEDEDDCGEYEKILFKLYDEDVIGEDFLGETKYFELSKVDCDKEYAEQMAVTRDGKEEGALFIVVEKDGCDSGGYDDKDDDKYDDKDDDKDDDKYDTKEDDKYDDKEDDKYDDKDDDKNEGGGKNKDKSRLL